MPLYDYHCEHCGESFEEFRRLAERESAPCPGCGKPASQAISGFFTSNRSDSSSGGRPSGGGCGMSTGGG